ncbi:hypothetical protein TSUD_159060 [Trifolium subterraneum]|uniref:Uncharacterized protein n=1 Tax=Trifolium subterraneum TaxID=3900 RepID=A0A2Z6N3M1_TRISU|nr:hypothetical protein TSUD_159060 [Trifolium subterraneum]
MINIEMEQDNSCVKWFLGRERGREGEEGKGVEREVPEKREGEGIALNWRELAVVGDEQRKWIDRIE